MIIQLCIINSSLIYSLTTSLVAQGQLQQGQGQEERRGGHRQGHADRDRGRQLRVSGDPRGGQVDLQGYCYLRVVLLINS